MSLLGSGSYHMTGRFARPLANSSSNPGAGEPKCQKCLQTGHWTYECKGQAAYQSRPSASKQLMNPAKRKYLNPEEVPEWMRYNKKELEEKQRQEADARRKQRKKKHKADHNNSSGSDTSSSSSSSTSSSSTSGSTTSSSTSDTSSSSSSSSSETSSGSDTSSSGDSSKTSDSSSSSSSDGDLSGRPHKRARRAASLVAADPGNQLHGRAQRRQSGDKPGHQSAQQYENPVRWAQDDRQHQLQPLEERSRGGTRQRGPLSPDSARPDGRVDGRAAAAAGSGDRPDRRTSREVRLTADQHDDRSASPPPPAAPQGRRSSSPGRWAGGNERLQRQTSGARQTQQRLAAPGGQGRYIRSQVAGSYRDEDQDMGYGRSDRHQPSDRGQSHHNSHWGEEDKHSEAVRNGRHERGSEQYDRYDRDRHWNSARRQDHSPDKRGHDQLDGSRDSRFRKDETGHRQHAVVRREPGPYRDRYTGVREDRRARSPILDRQLDLRGQGRVRSASRSLSKSPSRSLSRPRSSGSTSGSRSQGGSGSSDRNSRSSSSSSGRSNGSRRRQSNAAKKPLRRATSGAAGSGR